MALTPEQIKKMDAITGLNTPTPSGASERIQELRSSGGDFGTGFTPTFQYKTGQPVKNQLRMVGNIPRSGFELIKDIGTAVVKPRQTIRGVKSLVSGAAEAATEGFLEKTDIGQNILSKINDDRIERGIEPLNQDEDGRFQVITAEDREIARTVAQFFKERYGGIDNATETLTEDPVGAVADIAAVITGGGSILAKTGQSSKVGSLTRAGETLTKTGSTIEPINVVTKTSGLLKNKLSNLIGEGRSALSKSTKTVPIGDVKRVKNTASERGIDLPASAQTANPVTVQIETLAAKGIFGGKTRNRINNAINDITKIADDMLEKLGATDDPVLVGQEVVDGVNKFIDNFETTKNELYSAIDDLGDVNAVTESTKNITAKIQTQMADVLGTSPGSREIGKIIDDLNSKDVITFNTLKNTRSKIGNMLKSGDPIVNQYQGQLRKIYAALSDDLDATALQKSPEMADAFSEANKFYADNLNVINDRFIQKIIKQSDNPSKVVPVLVSKSTSLEDIQRLYSVLDENTIKSIQAEILDEVISNARSNTTGKLTDTGIDKGVNKIGRAKLNSILTPEMVKTLDDLDTLTNSMKNISKVAEGSQTAFISRLFSELFVGFVNLPAAIKLVAADAAISYLVGTKAGQRFLLNGFGGGLGNKIIKVTESGKMTPQILKNIENAISENRSGLFQSGRVGEVVEETSQ